ncbi:MAG: hypothetical protein AAF725_09245 [Acidobacteriota bacterium]
MLLTLLSACGGESAEDQAAAQNTALWTEIQQMNTALEGQRSDLQALEDQLAAAETAESAEGAEEGAEEAAAEEGEAAAEEAMTPEQIQAKIEEAQSSLSTSADELYGKIIDYLNNAGIVEGAEMTEEQKQAFALKASIDVVYAQEYIDRGGDYQKAIDIYSQALVTDPTNEVLLSAKAEAERLRYMDEERFAQVKKGMSQDEVRGLLGTVKNTNVREFTEQNRIGWFYRKEDRGAAGVYFKESKTGDGDWQVELTDYDAVAAPSAEESSEG